MDNGNQVEGTLDTLVDFKYIYIYLISLKASKLSETFLEGVQNSKLHKKFKE